MMSNNKKESDGLQDCQVSQLILREGGREGDGRVLRVQSKKGENHSSVIPCSKTSYRFSLGKYCVYDFTQYYSNCFLVTDTKTVFVAYGYSVYASFPYLKNKTKQ